MRVSNESLKEIYFGAYSFAEDADGYLRAYQYTEEQMAYLEGVSQFYYDRSMASTAKTFELITEAGQLSFVYRIVWEGSQDSFELAIDGQITEILYVKDLAKEGVLTFALPEGKKRVTVYLPADATVHVKDFEIDASFERPQKKEKVLWLGDSITQGFGPLRSGQTYVSVANRLLDYDIINQGIGGYVYDHYCLKKMEGYRPDKIIVAMGTNQYGDDCMDEIRTYYEVLTGLYGTEIPILCILPLWRGDNMEGVPTLISFCKKLRAVAESFPNVTIVDGFTLLPHLPEYFLDNLHPNCLGCEIYGRNLVEAIRRTGF